MSEDLGERLKAIMLASVVGEVLPAVNRCQLPDCWLAGGAVRNTVWNALFEGASSLKIKDYDVVFFDLAGGREQEEIARKQLEGELSTYRFDVKNQASFGVWREWRQKFNSTTDAISNWLHTATAVGVRLNEEGRFEILAPFGLEDLFNGILRPCPANADNAQAQDKAVSLVASCPVLHLVQ
jgi:hypothetical protein